MEKDETSYTLTDEGIELLATWGAALVTAGYDLDVEDSTSFWQAAAYLIANEWSEHSIEYTAVLLTFLGDDWFLLKDGYDA